MSLSCPGHVPLRKGCIVSAAGRIIMLGGAGRRAAVRRPLDTAGSVSRLALTRTLARRYRRWSPLDVGRGGSGIPAAPGRALARTSLTRADSGLAEPSCCPDRTLIQADAESPVSAPLQARRPARLAR